MHLHYHSCEVCNYTVPFRKSGEKSLKMCPCREAYYCGPEHQLVHWKIHKFTCYTKVHKQTLTPMDSAVNYLLQYHDTSLVEIAVTALMKENIDVDFAEALTKKAVVMTVQQKKDQEDIELAVAAGRIPPCQISWKDPEPYVVSLEEAARERGYYEPYFENPGDRMMRLKRGHQLSVSMIFLPTGRATAKRVPNTQLFMWDMLRETERTTTNPPKLYWHIHMLNGSINRDIVGEKEKAQGKGKGREDEVLGTS